MGIKEIFPNPTVKQVIFEIRFPNLFYIEEKIGEVQIRLMKDFPQSSLLFQRQLVIANFGPEASLQEITPDINKENQTKIWQLKNNENTQVNISLGSLSIKSEFHKTYQLGSDGRNFRTTINSITSVIFEVLKPPILTRLGLRYIDECPIFEKTNDSLMKYYNSIFPSNRFDLEATDSMSFKIVRKETNCSLIYQEAIKKKAENYFLIMDFDGFAEGIMPEKTLETTDLIHEMISREFETSIKEPLKEHMRKEKS